MRVSLAIDYFAYSAAAHPILAPKRSLRYARIGFCAYGANLGIRQLGAPVTLAARSLAVSLPIARIAGRVVKPQMAWIETSLVAAAYGQMTRHSARNAVGLDVGYTGIYAGRIRIYQRKRMQIHMAALAVDAAMYRNMPACIRIDRLHKRPASRRRNRMLGQWIDGVSRAMREILAIDLRLQGAGRGILYGHSTPQQLIALSPAVAAVGDIFVMNGLYHTNARNMKATDSNETTPA